MKKIWPWIALLFLLMILCLWTKLGTIYHTVSQQQTTVSVTHEPIAFDIVQNADSYQLSGTFKDTQQQQALMHCFTENGHTLSTHGEIATDQMRIAGEVIILVEEIIPYFTQHYTNGKIGFHNGILTLEGDVDSYAVNDQVNKSLAGAPFPIENHSKVVLPPEPVSFAINKEGDAMMIEGKFNSMEQPAHLSQVVTQGMKQGNIVGDAHYVDREHVLKTTEEILPCFAKGFTKGQITYADPVLTIEGYAKDQATLDELRSLLKGATVKVINHTQIDPAIAKAEAERLAKEAAQKAEAERLAAEAAKRAEEKRLAKEAAKRAEEERLAKKTEEKAKAERLAQEAAKRAEAERLAKEEAQRAEREEANKNIAALLKVENIEFDVAKETLTPKGRETVNKLAAILKQYPHIRVEIAGYTDSDGSEAFNLSLSQARVDSVKKALVEQGIDANRLEAKGYGEANPLFPNTTAENKQANRRVEIHILGE